MINHCGLNECSDWIGRKKAELFKVESWFLQHARRWLATTHAATPEWVTNAIKQDEVRHISPWFIWVGNMLY